MTTTAAGLFPGDQQAKTEQRLPSPSVDDQANILLVDDDPAKRLALTAVLESVGHNLVVAATGQEALRLLLQKDFAVVLLDVQMPDMDGFEIAKLMRDHGASRHTPIIFITAYGHGDIEVLRGYSLGAVDYIFTPVIPEILCAKVRVFIELDVMRKQLEAEIGQRKRAAAELEAANKELESFTYSVSHDLRAPLRTIDGFSRVLEEDYADKLDEEGRRLLTLVRDGSQRMSQLIDDLLAFSRFGREPIRAVEFEMGALAQTVFSELTAQNAGRPKLRLSVLPKAKGDPALIRQVWTNLLSNAIKYSAKRVEPVIEISGYTDGTEHVYRIKDNGAGFNMRYYEKLFGIFQRLHDEKEFPGTGVGLAIVQRVVSRHGGRIWAEGRVNEGAAFFFTLPTEEGALNHWA